MPKSSIDIIMIQLIMRISKITYILIIAHVLAAVRAGVINQSEITTTTVMTPTQAELLVMKKGEIGSSPHITDITPNYEFKMSDVTESLPITKFFFNDSKVKRLEKEKEHIELKIKQGNFTEEGETIRDRDMKQVRKNTNGFTELLKENDVSEDYFDFHKESDQSDDLDDITTIASKSLDLFQNSGLNLKSSPVTIFSKSVIANQTTITPTKLESNNFTHSADSEMETTTTSDEIQTLEPTLSPNIAENLANLMQKLQQLNRSENISQLPSKEQEVANDITISSLRPGAEKRGKFINDNSTNEFNLLNTSEVRTLLAMKTVPAKPVVPETADNKTLHHERSEDQNKNISAITSGNSEKTLLDWTHIMINNNLNNTSTTSDQHPNISTIIEAEKMDMERLHQERPYKKFSLEATTMIPPVDANSMITVDVAENAITTTESNELDGTEIAPHLAVAPTTERTATDVTLNQTSTSQTTDIGEMPLSSIGSATTFLPPTFNAATKQSSQPDITTLETIVSTESVILSEFLSTSTKPTAFPPSLTALLATTTTILSPSFPHDSRENNAHFNDENSMESTTENTITTTQLLSSDLSSPTQETTYMIMENTTNTAKTTQATAIKSVLDTPKNLSTTINETTIATTTPTTVTQIQSSTRQPLPENNLIMNLHPPQPAQSNDDNNDDNDNAVAVKINHYTNETSYDERTNAQVVGEEATHELSSSSGTTVSRSEAGAESTTALAKNNVNDLVVETTTIISPATIAAQTTPAISTTTFEVTTLTPTVSFVENETSHSKAFDSQRVTTAVDLDATFTTTTTTESFPTSSSAVETVLNVNKDVKSTTTIYEQEDFTRASTTATTLATVSRKTTIEPLLNFVETTTLTATTGVPPTAVSVTATPNEGSTVFQNYSTQVDLKQVSSQLTNNSINMNLIDQPENGEKLKENNENNLNLPAVSEAINIEELSSTSTTMLSTTTSDTQSTTTERLLISLLDDSTPSIITSSPSTSNEVYEVIATTEAATKTSATATSTTTTAIYEPTVEPKVHTPVPEIRIIAASTSVPTTIFPIELDPVTVVGNAGIGGPHLQPDSVDPPEMDTNVIIAISISVIGIIALILLMAFLYVVRKRQKQMSYGHRCRPVSLDAYSMDNVSVYNSVRRKGALRSSKRSYGNVAFDDPSLTHNLLNAAELSKFMERRSTIFEEFKYVPQIIARPDEVPVGCEDKNRYANVIPIPETRVLLQRQNEEEKSEYINANYVRGPRDSPNYYIACQAPLDSTVADFWRMIWEQKSRVIIQATDVVENGIEKCAEYLPPSVTLDNHTTYADFQVTLKHREIKDKYAISTLILKNTLVNASRELTHYWYKWPETGVPNEEAPIIAMLLEARCSLKTYAIEEANELKATSMSKSTTITTLKTDSRDISGATSPDNQSVNGCSGTDNKTNQSNSDIRIISANEKITTSATNSQGPLTVHCSPGTGRTGTIIACDIAIRSLETPKRSVDIPQIVYYVRRGRASAVQTKEQYEFIYKTASMYASKITNVSSET